VSLTNGLEHCQMTVEVKFRDIFYLNREGQKSGKVLEGHSKGGVRGDKIQVGLARLKGGVGVSERQRKHLGPQNGEPEPC